MNSRTAGPDTVPVAFTRRAALRAERARAQASGATSGARGAEGPQWDGEISDPPVWTAGPRPDPRPGLVPEPRSAPLPGAKTGPGGSGRTGAPRHLASSDGRFELAVGGFAPPGAGAVVPRPRGRRAR